LRVISNTGDKVHNGDVDSTLRDLALLHQRVLECLPPLKDAILPSAGNVTKIEFSEKFKSVQVVKNDGTVQIPRDWYERTILYISN